MSYQQIKVSVDQYTATALSDFFEKAQALAVTVEDAGDEPTFDVAHTSAPKWQQQVVTALFAAEHDSHELLAHLQREFGFTDQDIQQEHIVEQDWERSGLDSFKPIKVCDDFWVYPSWYEVADETATNIIIDPGLAFGTGSHATTYLCLQTMAKLPVDNTTVLDFGCGSGILAIAALKLGAKQAMAVDIDEKALTCTLENAQKNGVWEQISVMPAPPYEDFTLGQYDIVIANILAQALIDLKEDIVSTLKPDATLMLSGILAQQREMILGAYAEFDLTISQQDDWLVMCGKRRDV